jgi:hypothetical protein
MSRYIDLEELEKRINENIKPETLEEKALIEWCKDECIRQGYAMPTADVVEVVRCKDCAHYHEMKGFDYKGRKAHHCVWHSALRGENDYCSDGMRISERSENGK